MESKSVITKNILSSLQNRLNLECVQTLSFRSIFRTAKMETTLTIKILNT